MGERSGVDVQRRGRAPREREAGERREPPLEVLNP